MFNPAIYTELVNHFKTQAQCAAALDCAQSTVSQWLNGGTMSVATAIKVEQVTGRKFKHIDLVPELSNLSGN